MEERLAAWERKMDQRFLARDERMGKSFTSWKEENSRSSGARGDNDSVAQLRGNLETHASWRFFKDIGKGRAVYTERRDYGRIEYVQL